MAFFQKYLFITAMSHAQDQVAKSWAIKNATSQQYTLLQHKIGSFSQYQRKLADLVSHMNSDFAIRKHVASGSDTLEIVNVPTLYWTDAVITGESIQVRYSAKATMHSFTGLVTVSNSTGLVLAWSTVDDQMRKRASAYMQRTASTTQTLFNFTDAAGLSIPVQQVTTDKLTILLY